VSLEISLLDRLKGMMLRAEFRNLDSIGGRCCGECECAFSFSLAEVGLIGLKFNFSGDNLGLAALHRWAELLHYSVPTTGYLIG